MKEKISQKYFPYLLLIVNVCLVFLNLTVRPISIDEPFSIYQAQFSVPEIIRHLISGNNPPLFEILLHFWIKLFGISPTSVRTLPALFACASPIAVYFFVKKIFSVVAGIASSLLLSFSNLMLSYAHDCRVYSLFVLLTILSFYFFFELFNNDKPVTRIYFILFTCLLIYAHYLGFIILFFQAIYLLLYEKKRLLSLAFNYLVIFLLYFPYVSVILTRFVKTSSGGSWIKAPTGIDDLYGMLWTFSNAPVPTVMGIAILGAALLKNIFTKSKPRPGAVLIATWFLVPFLGMFALSFKMPMYLPRYLLFALPAYYILLALCIEYLFTKNIYRNIVLLILVAAFLFSHQLGNKEDQSIREMISIVKKSRTNKTCVLINTSLEDIPLITYHYNQKYFAAINDVKEYLQTDSLLKTDNIYRSFDLKRDADNKFDTLLYLSYINKAHPDLPKIKEVYSLKQENKIGSDFLELIFTK